MHNKNRRDGKREKEERECKQENKQGRVSVQYKRLNKFHILSNIC